MAAPTVIFKPPTGHVATEEQLVVPQPTRNPPQQSYRTPQGNKVPRRLRDFTLPAVPLSAGTTNRIVVAVPENAIWEIETLRARFVATATVGARNAFVGILSPAGAVNLNTNLKWLSSFLPITAGLQGSIFLGRRSAFKDGTNLGQGDSFTNRESWPIDLLPSGWRIILFDGNNVDVSDTVAVEAAINEYTTPKGLGRDEIPMGLESGFQWDLSDVRTVA